MSKIISIILPTYNEAENLYLIIPKIFNILNKSKIYAELIVVDDNSPDGTAEVAKKFLNKYPVKVFIRKNERGLGTAILKGLEVAKGEICLLMDADLSHPVEAISDMVKPIIENKADMTLASRYIKDGEFEGVSFIRRIISKIAGLFARGLTNVTDPTSGFMGIKKSLLKRVNLKAASWKLPLEIIVKCNPLIKEVPIVFVNRHKGKSKFGLRASFRYLQHLLGLYCYRFPAIFEFIKFCIVGLIGLIIDTAVLVSAVELFSLDPRIAAIFAFMVAVTVNYFLNRFWTFKIGKFTIFRCSYPAFVSIRLLGLGIRIVTMDILMVFAGMGKGYLYLLASIIGIFVATIFNFIGSKYFAFSKLFLHNSKDEFE